MFPELVHVDRAEAVEPPEDSLPLTDYDALGDNEVRWALTADDMEELTAAGNIGDPTVATEEKGEALVEAAVSNVCLLVDELEELRIQRIATYLEVDSASLLVRKHEDPRGRTVRAFDTTVLGRRSVERDAAGRTLMEEYLCFDPIQDSFQILYEVHSSPPRRNLELEVQIGND